MAGQETSRLTLAAEALGFDATASAVDTLAKAEARLTENQKALEAAKLGGNVDEVARLTDEQGKLRVVIDGLSKSQDRLNASERDWVGLLSAIHPSLGGLARTIVDLSKVLGDAAGGMSLLSKAGVVALPILAAIASAVRAMYVEFTQATQAIRDQQKALTELEKARRGSGQSIEDIRDASKLAPFSPESSQAATATFERIHERFPFIDEGALKETVAFTGGASDTPGGGRFGLDEIARSARALQLHPDKVDLSKAESEEAVARLIERTLSKFAEGLDKQFAREETQRRGNVVAAGQEVTTSGGSTLNLREIISRRAPEGANIEHLVDLAQKVQTREGLEDSRRMLEMAETGESPGLHVLRRASQAAGIVGFDAGKLDPRLTSTQADFAVLRGVFQEILVETKRQTEAIQGIAGQALGTTINHNNQNSKTYNVGRGSERRERNGNSRARDMETW